MSFSSRSGRNSKRVAIIHSFYSSQQPSGENIVVLQQAEALRRAGHTVEVFAQRTDERELSILYPLEAVWNVATGRGPAPQLADFNPDVVHVHNLFPNYGKRWISSSPVPVVTSLHNYRPLCAAGTFFRDGKVCTDCCDKRNALPAVIHGCYRGRIQSIPVAIGQRFEREPTLFGAGRVVALSDQMKDIYAGAGVPAERMDILPHFLPEDLDLGAGEGGDYWVYAGRLSAEKGVLDMVKEWPVDRKLLIVGQGELEDAVRAEAAHKNIEILGNVARDRLMELLRGALGLVFPSRWLEGFGLVYMESISVGTPVLAWDPSVVASFIRNDGTGSVVGAASLTEALDAAETLFPSLRPTCRAVFETKYTEQAWVSGMEMIYESAIRAKAVHL